jgi:2-hydroxychromene-2-carboxylate isomerase
VSQSQGLEQVRPRAVDTLSMQRYSCLEAYEVLQMSEASPQFLFDFGSPNAFLSHEAIPVVEKRIGVKFEYVPVLLGGIYKATNNKPPTVTLVGIKNKLEFLYRETDRFAERYGVAVPKLNPFSPVNTLALMRGAVAAQLDGLFGRYLDAVFFHMWIEPKDMSDPKIAHEALTASGLDAAKLFARAQDGEVKRRLLDNTESAVARGAFGVPTFFVGNEMYFGKDQLRDIEDLFRQGDA